MKIVIFDIETRLGPRDLHPDDEQEGWAALKRGEGGISAIVIYDSELDWTYMYDDNDIESAAAHIESADAVVSYCGEQFDVPVIEGVLGRKLRIKQHYDIYVEIKKENARRNIRTYRGEFTLNSVSTRTLGEGKNGSGEMVGSLLKLSHYGKLFNYCAQDVKLTRDLFKYLCSNKGVQGNNNNFLPIAVPEWLRSAMLKENSC